jgi:hypothetical protein
MKLIRTLSGFFVLIVIFGAAYIVGLEVKLSPCDTPLTYRIDRVDTTFGITRDELAKDTQQAAQIWNSAENKNLLAYDPSKGAIAVSIIFDQRQQLSNQINQLQGQIDTQKGSLDSQVAQFQNDKTAFEQKVSDLNSQIDYWNKKGGAPADIYKQLIDQQNQLKVQAQTLNQQAQTLNQSAVSYNSELNQLQQTVNTFNQALTYKPEEGLWDGQNKTITIYFDNTQDELVHTLAHELGHSLGMEHNQNPLSIMFPYSTSHVRPSSDDLAALDAICKPRSLIELGSQRLAVGIQILRQRYFSNGNLNGS